MAPEIPFRQRLCCSVREACLTSSWGHDKIFRLIKEGRLESRKIDGRRMIVIASLLQLLGLDEAPEPKPDSTAANPPKAKRSSARVAA
jgi:hypothetical protein